MPDVTSVAVGRQQIAVTDRGSGPPVLLLHGIGSAKDAFERQVPALEDSFRCVAWDAPGYGDSADPKDWPGVDGYAAAAAGLLDQLGLTTAHVVGVSWGGVIAVRLALRHPELVRSLVLAGSTRGSGRDAARASAMRRRGDELDRLGSRAFAHARAPKLVSSAAPPALVIDVATAMARSIRNPGYRWAAEAMAATDHLPQLPELRVPTLVIVGEHDTVTTVDASRELAANISGARLTIVAGAGHLVNQEQAPQFNRLLRGFLDEFESTAPLSPSVASHRGGVPER